MLLGAIADDFTGASDLANTLARGGMAVTQLVGVPDGHARSGIEAGVAGPRVDGEREVGIQPQHLDLEHGGTLPNATGPALPTRCRIGGAVAPRRIGRCSHGWTWR